jgi:hypothetical protein
MASIWRLGAGPMGVLPLPSVGDAVANAPAAQRTRGDGCAKRNNLFTQNRRFLSRGSSFNGLQKSAREVELEVDPEEQLPDVIPSPIQPNKRVFTGTLTSKPSPIHQKTPGKSAGAGDMRKGIRGLMIRNEIFLLQWHERDRAPYATNGTN